MSETRSVPADPADPRMVLTTLPDAASAERLARELVEARLAACVQLAPGLVSIYRWQGAVERADEVLLVAKTTAARVRAVEALIARLHPYEVPEFVVLEPRQVGAAYAAWLAAQTAVEPSA